MNRPLDRWIGERNICTCKKTKSTSFFSVHKPDRLTHIHVWKSQVILPFLISAITPSTTATVRLASLLSWLARSFCFFLLVQEDRSKPASLPLPLLWCDPPWRPIAPLPLLLDIFRHLALTGCPSPESLPLLGSGSELCLFLPGPAILAMMLIWMLPGQNQESHKRMGIWNVTELLNAEVRRKHGNFDINVVCKGLT